MKERIYKLKEFKAVKTLLALSLAFVLLFGICPVQASASTYPELPSVDGLHWALLKLSSSDTSCVEANTYLLLTTNPTENDMPLVRYDVPVTATESYSHFKGLLASTSGGKYYSISIIYFYIDGAWVRKETATNYVGKNEDNPFAGYLNVGLVDSYGVDVYLSVNNANYVKMEKTPSSYGNATETQWNDFLLQTKDFIGYHYVTENGATLWKEMRFDHVVYPYWEQGEDGVRKLMIYVPYEQTNYMTKDVGRYVEDGIYDYYISTVERTDEHCIQPYAWYTDYQPDMSTPEKVFEVIALPYFKDGYGADANAERTLIEVYDSKEDAISAYQADVGITPTPDPIYPIDPEPSPDPLPPTDDSESMGFVDFIKQFENLFNASGNLWKIMYYCFAYIPQQILWCMWSAVQIFLAVMIIKWIRE